MFHCFSCPFATLSPIVVRCSFGADLLETADGGLHCCRSDGGELPAAARNCLATRLGPALEDATSCALDAVLATELAMVLGALQDLIALDNLPQRIAIPGAILACDSNLLGVFCHCSELGMRCTLLQLLPQ